MSDRKFAQLKNQEEVKKTLENYCLKGGHRLPQTRREFLASGLMSLSATVMAPTLQSMIFNKAHAATGCTNPNMSLPPFIQISLAGGAALCANFVAGDEKGQMLSNYQRMGLGTQPQVDRIFNNQAPFARGSGFLTGVRAAGSTVLNKTSFCAMSAFSFDDTADNEQNIVGMVAKAGNGGQFLPTTLASSQIRNNGQIQVSNARYFSTPAFIPPSSPLKVGSVAALTESLDLGAPSVAHATSQLTASKTMYKSLLNLVENLSRKQLDKMQARNPSTEEFKELVDCAIRQNAKHVRTDSQMPNLDIEKNSSLSGFWLNDADAAKNKILGSVVLATLNRTSGPAYIQLGGYDYHQGAGSRVTSNQMDQFAGALVGRILRTASILNTPVFIYVTSDGSTFSPDSASNTVGFTGDRATHGLGFMFGFNPSGAPSISGVNGSPSYQLNHFDSVGLETNTAHMVGKNVPISSAAAFANYLSFAGQLKLLTGSRDLLNVYNALNEAGSVDEILRFRG